jgi:hypothetical protein
MALHHDRYHFAAWLHPALLSLSLAKLRHKTHLLPALHSFALAAPTHIQARGVLLFLSRPLLLHTVWHLLICMRRDVFYVSNLTTLCQRIMPPRNTVPTQRAWEPLAWVGVVKVSSSATVHIEMEEQSTTTCDHAATTATSRHPSYMLVVSTIRYVLR